MYSALRHAFERMSDIDTAVKALQEAELYRQKIGDFGSEMAMRMALDRNTTPCKCPSSKRQ